MTPTRPLEFEEQLVRGRSMGEGADPVPPAGPHGVLAPPERLLWTVLRRLEALALERYERFVPALAMPAKRTVVERLRDEVPTDEALAGHELDGPMRDLCSAAATDSALATLCVQGLTLERLGQAIYARLATSPGAGPMSRHLADLGGEAARVSIDMAISELQRRASTEDLLAAYCTATRPVLACFDDLSDTGDRALGPHFGLRFMDVLTDVATELIDNCVQLGMDRRKLVCHLTAAFMGA
jgi:hypothetical protein